MSGSFSLAYTNAAGTAYNDDAFGTALSPFLDLPDQSGVAVTFQLWYEIESCCDDLDLFLVTDAGDINLGNWAGTSETFWQEVSIDVTEWAGQTVQFRFEFESDGSVPYAGPFIDDLSITQECCSDDAECDDGNPCTVDTCPGIDSLCAFIPIEGCCTTDEECGDGDPCTQDSCTSAQGGECLNIWICCESDDDCDDGEDVCTEDVCVDSFCQFIFTGAPGCCQPLLWEDAFENGQGEWVFSGGDASHFWHLSTVKSQDGATALHYGDLAGGDYTNDQDGVALSPLIELGVQPGLALNLWVWYDTEGSWDYCRVFVVHDGSETQLAQYIGHDQGFWEELSYSLEDWAGQTIQLKFLFHSDFSGTYQGVWLDGLSITQGCCNADVDCEDDNPCTIDECPGLESMCNNTWIEGCCLDNAGCDDGDPCTDDMCTTEGGVCVHTEICCESDDDCDDGDDVCTDDVCVDDFCQFIPTGAEGCCVPVIYENDFEGDLDGWIIDNSSGTYGWQLSTAKAVSGSQSLAYTDAGGTSYGNSNQGSILSPELELPNQPGLSLSFQLWYEIESCCDDFDLSVVHYGGTTHIANYAGTGAAAWQLVAFDADEYKGQTVQLLMEFSCDGSFNYDGVFVDDLMLTQDCCSDDADCDDGNPCTADSCPGINKLCVFEPIPDCCETDADCDDGNPCTVDSCPDVDNLCLFEPIVDCCITDADCDDGDSCTEDSCPGPGSLCLFVPIVDCCIGDGDCDDGDICTEDSCVDGSCVHTPTGACCTLPLFADDFSTDQGWTLDGEWEWGEAQVSSGQGIGNPDPDEDHTGSADDLIIGVVLGGNAATSVPHPFYYATSPAVDASGINTKLKLSYWRILNSDLAQHNDNIVEVWDGAVWQVIYEPGAAAILDATWTYFEYDITAYANEALQVRFGYDMGDSGMILAGSSWNLDDVWIQEDVSPFCCTWDSDCEGMDLSCSGGVCQ